MVERTLISELEIAARSRAGIRFLDRSERATLLPFEELHRRAVRCAAGLTLRGIRKGDVVALVLPTSPDFFDAFFGALLAGAIPVPLYPPVRMGRMDEYHQRTAAMLGHVDAKVVLTDARVRRVLGRTVELARPPLGCPLVEEVSAAADAPIALPAADDPALIQFSSGSTAQPKPVLLTHRQLLANVDAIVHSIDVEFPEAEGYVHAGVSWLPLYHDMGLVGCVLPAINAPRDLTLIPPELFLSRPAIWLRAISRYRATVSPAPNFAYGLCADRIKDQELEGVDLSSWRMALNGAEPVAPETLEKFIARFSPYGFRAEALTPVYGLSEAALAVTFSPPKRRFRVERFDIQRLAIEGRAEPAVDGRDLVSVGQPLPGFAIKITDAQGGEVGENIVGRVWVRGPSIMSGYYRQEEATRAALKDGWLDTGDLGFMRQGELYLHGRAKDLLVVRGRKYAPQEIEQLLDALPGVRTGCTAAVSFAPQGADTERLLLLVERARDAEGSDASLREAVRGRIAEGAGLKIDELQILEPGTLPRTSSGKMRRSEALARFLAGTLLPPKPVTPIRLAGEMLRSVAAFARSSRDH
ncbi:MAG: fatty acyl-AMP ligase [Deltaproteobacteria bacterium]|nr:fatty acyl-AMP ligase [Deltaproteobacteria bacterium]